MHVYVVNQWMYKVLTLHRKTSFNKSHSKLIKQYKIKCSKYTKWQSTFSKYANSDSIYNRQCKKQVSKMAASNNYYKENNQTLTRCNIL